MSEQVNRGQVEEQETPSSGLLLSVEPLQGGEPLGAKSADTTDTDTDMQDTSDQATDADGTDESDADGTDASEGDGTDGSGGDGTDASVDTDGTDS